MRPIDADALIEKCGGWYVDECTESGFIGTLKNLLSTMPTIQHEKAQLPQQCTTSDLISRQAVLDAIVQCTNCGDEDTLREYVLKHSLDNGWTGGILEALDAVKDLPPAQPEPTDIDAREVVYNLAEKIGIHQLFALTVELRGEPIQPELTYEQVEEYCKKRCLHVVTDDFFESTKPQRLGHWILYDKRFPWRTWYKCSECGNYLDFSGVNGGRGEANYCPNCGAKMKGGAG